MARWRDCSIARLLDKLDKLPSHLPCSTTPQSANSTKSSRPDDTPVLLYDVFHILIRMCFVVLRCKPTPSLHKVCFVKYRELSRNQIPLEVVLDRPGLRCRARVSFEWYPDETAHCDWIPSISLVLWIPSYWGLDDTGHITL